MSEEPQLPFERLMAILQDASQPLSPQHLYRLSDLEGAELALFQSTWSQTPAARRQAVMEDIEMFSERDYVLSFEAVSLFALQDEDARVRELAIRSLWDYENETLIPTFLQMLQADPAASVRAAAASALGHYVYLGELEEIPAEQLQQIVNRLLQVYRGSENMLVRRRALESLGFSGHVEVPDLIEAAYQTGHNDWLVSAFFAMGRSANQKWAHNVLANLGHDVPEVRLEAARAAGELELAAAVDPLIDMLADEDVEVRLACAWSLSQIGGQGVQEALEEMYEEAEDDEEAEFIEAALDNLAFTEDLNIFSLLDFSEDGERSEMDEEGLLGALFDDEEFDLEDDEDTAH